MSETEKYARGGIIRGGAPIKLSERLGIGIDGVCIYAAPEPVLTPEEMGRIVNEPAQEDE
ncbi:hypothetical protein [Nocardia xishanensis]|uniref:hypothetical protein n=1 Tax=Nocardia xishanensis TaxID=238964 RepID=UPI00082DE8DB|nr:hypothetical protein [Nocardia xishanensis]